MNLVAIDPGKHASGIAVFAERTLVAVYYTNDTFVLGWIASETPVIVELPQVYTTDKSKGDPNDLVELAFAAGRITRLFDNVETVRPSRWKGQLPKDVHHARVQTALSDDERAVVARTGASRGKLHNVLDAVALGVWKLGRM